MADLTDCTIYLFLYCYVTPRRPRTGIKSVRCSILVHVGAPAASGLGEMQINLVQPCSAGLVVLLVVEIVDTSAKAHSLAALGVLLYVPAPG